MSAVRALSMQVVSVRTSPARHSIATPATVVPTRDDKRQQRRESRTRVAAATDWARRSAYLFAAVGCRMLRRSPLEQRALASA
ncbi:hypothetical protein ACO0LM_28710, partial [Undibacterium sp. Di26W]|uniref:hypothetical protein n=1 Tax=Undibacterium sp. Di26W TaxID=3413035 RepID=UPI003BF120E7